MIDDATRAHIMAHDDPEMLRGHMLNVHVEDDVIGMLIRSADHMALDLAHIEAHRKGTDGTRSTTGAADAGHDRAGAPNREASRHHPFLPGADKLGRDAPVGDHPRR